mmetsp:Transcript_72329/g.127490  ORF Transcript_72329/g.127490 Transcript_72329/m.127490 type:complete len:223 (+) Transcript_72329:560-1228(+)
MFHLLLSRQNDQRHEPQQGDPGQVQVEMQDGPEEEQQHHHDEDDKGLIQEHPIADPVLAPQRSHVNPLRGTFPRVGGLSFLDPVLENRQVHEQRIAEGVLDPRSSNLVHLQPHVLRAIDNAVLGPASLQQGVCLLVLRDLDVERAAAALYTPRVGVPHTPFRQLVPVHKSDLDEGDARADDRSQEAVECELGECDALGRDAIVVDDDDVWGVAHPCRRAADV